MPICRYRFWLLILPLFAAVPGVGRAQASAAAQAQAKALADSSWGFRIIVSIAQRRLWVIDEGETLYTSKVGVGSGRKLSSGGETWTFDTPLGLRTVVGKDSAPVWIPPEWYYIETARENHLALAHLDYGKTVRLADGRGLTIRAGTVGIVGTDSLFSPLPVTEHIIFGGTLYVPPPGSKNRAQHGTLGNYRLDLGDAVGMHGTKESASVGHAVTHGCMRLYDRDIEWLYHIIPVGTRVYIY